MKLRRNVLQPLRIFIEEFDRASSVHSPYRLPSAKLQRIASQCLSAYHATTSLGEAHVMHRPSALLHHYSQQRRASVLGHLFHVANRIHATVDTVVVLSQGDAALGAKAIAEACTQPYWNHLSRAERGSKPRIFFIDDQSDNDSIQGLLHMLGAHRPTNAHSQHSQAEDWALVVLSGNEEPDGALWQWDPLLAALKRNTANQPEQLAQRLIAVSPEKGPIADRIREYGSSELFRCYDDPSPLQCFGPLGLLPATLLGVNIMELLAGASWMSQHFGQANLEENLVLRYIAWQICIAAEGGLLEDIHVWNPGLEAWLQWHHALTSCFRPSGHRARNRCEMSIEIDRPKFDPIEVADGATAPGRLKQRIDQHREILIRANIPQARVHLGELDELHMGQLMQLMLLVNGSGKLSIAGSQGLTCDKPQRDISPETDG